MNPNSVRQDSEIGIDRAQNFTILDQWENEMDRKGNLFKKLTLLRDDHLKLTKERELELDEKGELRITTKLKELDSEIKDIQKQLNLSKVKLDLMEPIRSSEELLQKEYRKVTKRSAILVMGSLFVCSFLSVYGILTLRNIRSGIVDEHYAIPYVVTSLFAPLFVFDFFGYKLAVINFQRPILGISVLAVLNIWLFRHVLNWARKKHSFFGRS